MKFFDYIKKFFLFTLQEIYSFFLKMALFLLILFILMTSLMAYFVTMDKKESQIPKNYRYVLFNPSGVTEDKIIGTGILADSEKYNISFSDILDSLEDMKENSNIDGIVIAMDQIGLNSAQTEELAKKFEELKEAGKKIYAFGTYLHNKNYLLAATANEIIMVPSASASVSLTGYSYSNIYYKKLLDNLGIDMEVVRVGDFKSYGENYTSDTISEGLKKELTRILENRYSNFTGDIAKSRKITIESLNKEILDGNMAHLTPFTARDKKLVDKLESFQDFTGRLGITKDGMVDIYDYYQNNKERLKNRKEGYHAIAVIYAEGSIIQGGGSDSTIAISPENIGKKLEKALKISNLKGIVLRVNSPGGSALASEMIYQSLMKANVPVYVSMSGSAASGGYYISMAGKKVFADKATITGSIGVVSMLPKLYNAQKKYGVTSNSISKGKYTDMYDPFVPLSEESRVRIAESMNDTYKEFKSRVSASRNIDDATLETYAQGKIWLGTEAKEIKLVDGIAGLEETIMTMARDLEISEDFRIANIYTEIDFKQTLRMLSSFVLEKFSLSSQIKDHLPKEVKIYDEYKLIEENRNRPMYYLPYRIDF